MPFEAIVLTAVIAAFGAFGIVMGYVGLIAKENAITFQQERDARLKTA